MCPSCQQPLQQYFYEDTVVNTFSGWQLKLSVERQSYVLSTFFRILLLLLQTYESLLQTNLKSSNCHPIPSIFLQLPWMHLSCFPGNFHEGPSTLDCLRYDQTGHTAMKFASVWRWMNSSANASQDVDLVYWMVLFEPKILEGATELSLQTKKQKNPTHPSFLQGYQPSPCMQLILLQKLHQDTISYLYWIIQYHVKLWT